MSHSWNYIKFGELFDYENKSKIKAGYGLASGLYPFYTSSVELTKFIDEFQFDRTSLIFGTGGNASIHYCDNPFSVSTDCLVAIAKDETKVCPKYVFFYLSGNLFLLEEGFKGAGLKHISKGYINDLQIPLPPLPIQRRIAEILDAADALRRKDRELLKKYDELAQAIFIDMFGERQNLKKMSLKELALQEKHSFSNGPFGSDLLTSELKETGVPVIYIRDIRNGYYKWKSNVYVTPEKAKQLQACKVISGDILVTKVGDPPGMVAVYPDGLPEAIITQDVIRIRANKNLVYPSFLQYYLNSDFGKKLLDTIIVEGTRSRFPLGEFKKVEIPVPSIELQKSFSKRLSIINEQKLLAESYLSNNLFQTLIQKAFKGELVA